MKVYGKILEPTKVELAPVIYKNISNFNLSEELMEEEGFKPVIFLFEKLTGLKTYFYENTEIENPELYTDIPFPGYNYQWSEESNSWYIPLDIIKNKKGEEIRKDADKEASGFKTGYSLSEQETWARQEKGAKELLADPDSTSDDAQWVKLLATTRNLSVMDQVEKILNAVTKANYAAALILSKQQKIEDIIRTTTTEEDILKIHWNMIPTFPTIE